MELRCPAYELHGRLEEGLIEVRCRNRRCGYEPGVVVLHYFDAVSGKHVNTKRFSDPARLFSRGKKKEAS